MIDTWCAIHRSALCHASCRPALNSPVPIPTKSGFISRSINARPSRRHTCSCASSLLPIFQLQPSRYFFLAPFHVPCQVYTQLSFASGVQTHFRGTVRIVGYPAIGVVRSPYPSHQTTHTTISAFRAENGPLNPSFHRTERRNSNHEMSFGASPSDVVIVVAFCRALHRKCRDAGAEYDEIRDEVRGTHYS
jgi:hypothetical protein